MLCKWLGYEGDDPLVWWLNESLPSTDPHQTQLTHTDLKPENVLFVSSDFCTVYDARKVNCLSWVLSLDFF